MKCFIKYHNKIINGTTIKCINQKNFLELGSIKRLLINWVINFFK